MERNKVHKELCLIYVVVPKNIDEVCKDDYWIKDMKEELEHIEKKKTLELVPRPKDKNVVGTKQE